MAMKLKTKLLIGAALVSLPLITLSGCNVGQYEEPRYTVSQTAEDGIEIREYTPTIVAQAEVTGPREEAISAGFRLVADYIFGNNAPQQKISMTTPVIQQAAPEGKKIAMTAPVIQQAAGTDNKWVVQFVMPSEYTLETLPKPNKPEVKLLKVPAQKMLVIRFSGSTRDANIAKYREQLQAYATANKIKTVGAPVLAFYDPPWTLPFMRRNEVMLQLAK